ncbi:Nn.00g047410.m01.CDS01 [Neocucurbitaria sp. VM-36]
MATPESAAPVAGHRRNKSSSVLKSIMAPKSHKRAPSDGTALNKNQFMNPPYMPASNFQTPLLPPDHPHGQVRTSTRTENIPINPPSPRKSQDVKSSPKKSLHKKTLSSVSLRSLARKDEKSKDKQAAEAQRAQEEEASGTKPKKTKSSTNLAAMFGKSKSRDNKQSPIKEPIDKENTTPPSSASAAAPPRMPIWAEFSSQQEVTTTSKIPLNDQRRSIEKEIALYTPQDYSPSKQRNFFDYGQPSLQQRPVAKERPKSMVVPKSTSTASLFETFTRKKSSDRVPLSDTKGNEGRIKESSSSKSIPARPVLGRASTDTSRTDVAVKPVMQPTVTAKKPNRVMAAVAAFNGKSKQTDAAPLSPTKLDPEMVDAEFEVVLESRNIPTHQRAQMRTLKLEVKADFVRMHKLDTPQASRATSSHSSIGETKPVATRSSKSRDGTAEEENESSQADKSANSTKRERPRSRAFTFSRSDSPTKKQKGDAGDRKASSKSTPIPKSPSTRSLVSNASDRSVSNGAKAVKSDEFIAYLKKTPKPQNVEVGKLHKLRLLLRNETVEWVDTFIQDGGMAELVGLLHRIMEIEWREDHEDTLLHELLRCLKGLCTTATALKQLKEISTTLYPALLAMLFDEEHKGPSEFTTRELIIEIIFAHISTAPESELESRATELLKYLKDPTKEKESSTVPFILQMHQPRPYQVWCKEMTNVTKEVFWIFIHHLNVIPVPPKSSQETHCKSYAKTHFPGQRAIVPAAPYVGGVEWDATNYLATHIDLLNGLIASLPTQQQRNTLRQELKVSGFERLMGHLRACNPKYYGAVHDSVKVWIGAALEDDWDVRTVRMGAGDGKGSVSPVKQSPKKKAEKAPQIGVPKMDLDLGLGLGFDREIAIGGLSDKKDDDWI